jgi:uncharacterized membrane protein YbhN (UPF0104 family)
LTTRQQWRRRGRLGLYAVAVALLGWLVWQVDRVQLWAAISRADARLLALAVVVVLAGCMGTGALRLWLLLLPLRPERRPPGVPLFALYLASSGASQVLPSPTAEVIRFVQLNRTHGYAGGLLLAALSAEKVLEAATSGLGLLLTAAVAPVPSVQLRALAVMGTLFLAILAAALVLARVLQRRGQAGLADGAASRERPGVAVVIEPDGADGSTDGHGGAGGLTARAWAWLSQHLRRLGEGLGRLSPATWARALAVSVLFDLANAVSVGLCLAAVGVSRPVSVWILLVLISRFSSLVPMSPGHFGVQEAAMVLALRTVSIDGPTALAVALLYRAVHFVPVTLAGLLALRWLGLPVAAQTAPPAGELDGTDAGEDPGEGSGEGPVVPAVQPTARTG